MRVPDKFFESFTGTWDKLFESFTVTRQIIRVIYLDHKSFLSHLLALDKLFESLLAPDKLFESFTGTWRQVFVRGLDHKIGMSHPGDRY